MAAVRVEIGQSLGQAFGRGLTDALACCWVSTVSDLTVLAAFPFGCTLRGIVDERDVWSDELR